MVVTTTSLELNWLARHDKELPLPEIVFSPNNEDASGRRVGGCYYLPAKREFLFGDVYVPLDHGVILVGCESPETIAGTIAHEWRHHWQTHRGIKLASQYNAEDFASWDTYGKAIRRYFRNQSHEMDALLYQHKKARDWSSDYIMDLTFGKAM
jgi:hypothetical protein